MSSKLDESFLRTLDLPAGAVAVDCGASVGDVTAVFREKGLIIHAFEPNPLAYERLAKRFEGDGSVFCYPAAVSDQDGEAHFYPHEDLTESTLETANGSSLLGFKKNVLQDKPMSVKTIDLARFLEDLGTDVEVLKIDIEGAEIEVVNHLIDEGAHKRAKMILVETHERKIAELREPTTALTERLEQDGIKNIRLDWH